MSKKITQNINKDAGLLDRPEVRVPHSKWETKSSNYISSNIGDIVPVFVDEVVPSERRKITMGMLSHMTTPIAPIFNAQYTEFRAFFVPHRLSADLLGGYKTRKSPFVKVFGEDPAATSADIIVPINNQKLPDVSSNLNSDFCSHLEAFGGIADALDIEVYDAGNSDLDITNFNFLDMAAYELIYQYKYRNQNREAATNSDLYKWLYNLYNRTSVGTTYYNDKFHTAQREKDYFTGSMPFTQKGDSVKAGLVGTAPIIADQDNMHLTRGNLTFGSTTSTVDMGVDSNDYIIGLQVGDTSSDAVKTTNMVALLSGASAIDINQLRVMIKLQEALEKDALWGSDYANALNSKFGTCPMSLIVEEPLELKRVTITSQMQPIFQTSSTSSEPTILGQIGANATTQSGEFEIVPETEFKEYGYLIICACHKAQNSYDSLYYKPKRIFKKARFDFFDPSLNDLGYQPISRIEFSPDDYTDSLYEAVSYNEAWAEYRFKFNKVHGMFEPARNNALSYWTLACSGYTDIQSLYKQGVTELNRAISVSSTNAPQFFDAYGFVEVNSKPMSLHSIPGMDGVI